MNNALGIIFSNIHDDNIPELTQERTLGSIPICGRYRLIDFALSNMVNSNVTKVGVITKSNFQSLMDHVGSGKDWDLARRQGGLHILPPFGVKDNALYKTRLEALKGALDFIKKSDEEFVVMSDCDIICTMDYSKVIKKHIENNSDITLIYVNKDTEEFSGAFNTMTMVMDDNERVKSVIFDPDSTIGKNVYTNVCVIRRTLLISMLNDTISRGYSHFGKDLIARNIDTLRIFGYKYDGYFVAITSLNNYFTESMNLLDRANRDKVFRKVDVYTKVKDSVPSVYTTSAYVKNSLIADGCIIEGCVENSIIFRGVKISKGAIVKNSIVLQGSIICNDATINCIVADKNVVIKDGVNLSGAQNHPFYIPKNSII